MTGVGSYLGEAKGKRRRSQIRVALAVFFLIAYLLALGAAWIVFRSPLFRFTSLVVTGNATIPTDAVMDLLQATVFQGKGTRYWLGFKNLLIWPPALSEHDLRFLPAMKSVTIGKNYRTRSITVTVEERKPYGIRCIQARTDADGTRTDAEGSPRGSAFDCWWFDGEGVVFRRGLAAQGNLIPAVFDYSQENLGLGKSVLPNGLLPNLFSVFDVLRESGLAVKMIHLDDIKLQEITAETFAGPKLYFSLRFPASNDLAALRSLVSAAGFGNLKYVDFRTENRVYYE